MSAFKDYVLTKDDNGKMNIYTTNAWTHLNRGDLVLIDHANAVEVVNTVTLEEENDKEIIDFIMAVTGKREIRTLYGKVLIMKFEEEEDEDE